MTPALSPHTPAPAALRAEGAHASAEERVFVTLTLAEQLCGIPVELVRDVLKTPKITRIPLAPPEVAGSLNLRGRIVTAIDLRRRLGLPPRPPAEQMAVVTEQGAELYAFLVDQVSEVLSLSTADFEPNPPTLALLWASQSQGIYRLKERLMVVLDINRLLMLGKT
jgi:purine-binding chemotaxis protein CheW